MAENEAEKKNAPPAQSASNPGKEEAKTPAAAPKPGAQQFLYAALLVGMVAGSGSAAVVVASLALRGGAPAAAASTADEKPASDAAGKSGNKPEKPCEFTLENPLIVNVYETQERRYLSVKPVLVLDGATTLEKVKASQAELQNLLIGLLKGKTLEQLDDPDAVNIIGREVQETANLKLNLGHSITRVYFTQFVVQ